MGVSYIDWLDDLDKETKLTRAMLYRHTASIMPYEFKKLKDDVWKIIDPETGSWLKAKFNAKGRLYIIEQYDND